MASSNKKPKKKKSKKVPVAAKIKVVKLKCPNCGEEDERVSYCEQCEGPMDVVDVLERDENEVNNDIAVSKVVTNSDSESGDDEVNSKDVVPSEADVELDGIMEKGLGDIFPGDSNPSDSGGDSGAESMDLNDALDALDNE